jgi:hypothetical protein
VPTDLAALAHRRWFCGTVLAVLALVAATSLCLLGHPQLEPDDYRFLTTLQERAAGRISPWQAGVLENRWDHLWWIADTDAVRFFRPTLIASYWLDVTWLGGSAGALLRTNLVLHAAVCVLVTVLAFRLLRLPIAACAASLLYAAFACHAETLWYVAGRNETLAALGFLGAVLLHDSAQPRRRWLALPCFLFALLSKELTLGLPLLCVAWNVQVRRRQPTWRAALVADRWLWLGCLGVIAVAFVLRRTAMPGGSELVFPYFVAPWRPEFAGHVVAGLRNYLENLGTAQLTVPFLQPAQYATSTSLLGTIAVFAGLGQLVPPLWREPRARWAALLALGTWLPVSVVYISERYLVLPAVGLALAVGLLLERARGPWRIIVGLAVLVWIGHQSVWLHAKNLNVSGRPRDSLALQQLVDRVQKPLRAARAIYFVDFPGGTIHAQFAGVQVRHMLGAPDVPVHVLTTFPMNTGRSGELQLRRVATDTLELAAAAELVPPLDVPFAATPQEPGTVVARTAVGAKVQIVASDGGRATRLHCRLPRPLDDCTFVRWLPPEPFFAGAPHGVLASHGQFVLVNP